MPSVGERKNPNMGNFTKDPMYAYASAFCEAQQNILRESQVDYGAEPVRALAFKSNVDKLKRFFVENSIIGSERDLGAEKYQDQLDKATAAYEKAAANYDNAYNYYKKSQENYNEAKRVLDSLG